MNDMRSVIVPKSDQMNADDLIGGAITIKITRVEIKPGEQPISIFYESDGGKPYKCCKSMARVMVACWGPDANVYAGRSMTLYRDPRVKWGGLEVGGIRISHMTDIQGAHTMALTETRGSKKPFTVKPLTVAAHVEKAATPVIDKVAAGVTALIERIQDADGMADLQAITADAVVIKQRKYLAASRPELAQRVDEAVDTALALCDGSDASDAQEDAA